jgi:hypothetical protein
MWIKRMGTSMKWNELCHFWKPLAKTGW